MKSRIAVIDDEIRLAKILGMMLRREGWEVEVFQTPHSFIDELDDRGFDLVLTDLKMPGMDGLDVLEAVKEREPDIPVVIITAHGTVETAIRAMKEGAYDYVQKPFDNDEVKALALRALERTRLARENRYLRAEVRSKYALENIVAESEAMRDVFDLAHRAARSPATVLITGDSGTGKELVARAIHYWSDRVGKPFVAVNCKAFASGVLESELFGHEKGAFTGAGRTRAGVFERAFGGTAFLDEIGEVDDNFQGKLLRVLQEREVRRVGADELRPIDVRVVAATNRDLEVEIDASRFREDLYFRLAVIPIHIPPLADRRADILPLARHFLQRASDEMGRSITGWSEDVEEYLQSHEWPGNVRELENAIERAVVLARGDALELDDILVGGKPRPSSTGDTLQDHLDRETERKIREVLHKVDRKRVDAADRLGIDRSTLYRLMKKHGIDGDAV